MSLQIPFGSCLVTEVACLRSVCRTRFAHGRLCWCDPAEAGKGGGGGGGGAAEGTECRPGLRQATEQQ